MRLAAAKIHLGSCSGIHQAICNVRAPQPPLAGQGKGLPSSPTFRAQKALATKGAQYQMRHFLRGFVLVPGMEGELLMDARGNLWAPDHAGGSCKQWVCSAERQALCSAGAVPGGGPETMGMVLSSKASKYPRIQCHMPVSPSGKAKATHTLSSQHFVISCLKKKSL